MDGDRCDGRGIQWTHLGFDVVEGGRADDGKADEEDIGLGVGKRAKAIVIFLSSSIPQS